MAFNKDKSEAAKSMFTSSVKGFANVAAVGVTFVTTPLVFELTKGWVHGFTARNYGPEWTDVTGPAWFVILAAANFFGARASLATALVFGGFALAARIF